jgi:uncharacterized membrane protein YbhN (UPF0104 family)
MDSRLPVTTSSRTDGPIGDRASAALSRIRRAAASPWGRRLGWILSAGLLAYLLVRLVQGWHAHPIDLGGADHLALALAIVLSALGVAGAGAIWVWILRRLGCAAPASWIGLFFQGQLGKYLPGSVWQYAGRVGLLRVRGVSVATASASIGIELGASVAAACLTTVLLLGLWAGLGLWAAAVVLWLGSRRLSRRRAAASSTSTLRALARLLAASWPLTIEATALYVGMWVLYGSGFAALAKALFDLPLGELAYYVGAFAVAWVVGLAAVFAPGGIGVREAVLVALLRGRLGSGDAVALAFASRLLLSAIDLAAGAAAMLLWRRQGRIPEAASDT